MSATVYVALFSSQELNADVSGRGANYFFGGLLLVMSALLEFFLGNTFPAVVFFGRPDNALCQIKY